MTFHHNGIIYLQDFVKSQFEYSGTVIGTTIGTGHSSKTLGIFGTPLSCDAKLGSNRASPYFEPTDANVEKVGIPVSDLHAIRKDMLKDYEDAIRSNRVSVFVSPAPFEDTRSAEKQEASKGSLPTSVGSGAILHFFGHWHEPDNSETTPIWWVNPAMLSRINTLHYGGHTVDIPFEELPDVDDISLMDVPFAGGPLRKGFVLDATLTPQHFHWYLS